jgi:hypothetical protein
MQLATTKNTSISNKFKQQLIKSATNPSKE